MRALRLARGGRPSLILVHTNPTINKAEPVWNPQQESFIFAVAGDTRLKRGVRRHRGIPVDFSTRTILIDFQGGKQEALRKDAPKIVDESPLEVLLLSPAGAPAAKCRR